MSQQSQKQSAIAKLLGLVNQPRSDYRPATDVFLDLDVDRVAAELRLVELGADRGAGDRPAQNAQTLDDVEHRIIERIESHKQDAHKLFLDHLHTYDERMIALDFESRFAVIQQAAPQAVGDFRAEAALGRNELFSLRRRLYDAEQEREHFRTQHNLKRAARVSTTGKTILKIGILAVMFVLEIALNGSFLAKSNEQGILGGAVQAVSFAALNIIASFLWGLVPIRLINRRNIALKFIGLIALIGYLAFACGLNLTLAHLREIPATVTGDVGQEVLARLLSAPHVLNDVNSWVFFGIGFIFSLIAMADGLTFTDPYPGYAALEKRWLEAGHQYTDRSAALIDQLRDIRDEASEVMNEAASDLSVRRGEYDAILQARSRLSQRFMEHQAQIGRASNALLAVYREANRKARKTPSPSYFGQPYELERIVYTSHGDEETAREQLRRSIAEAQSVLKEQVKAIHAAFEEAVRSYREIDELIPESRRVAASA